MVGGGKNVSWLTDKEECSAARGAPTLTLFLPLLCAVGWFDPFGRWSLPAAHGHAKPVRTHDPRIWPTLITGSLSGEANMVSERLRELVRISPISLSLCGLSIGLKERSNGKWEKRAFFLIFLPSFLLLPCRPP